MGSCNPNSADYDPDRFPLLQVSQSLTLRGRCKICPGVREKKKNNFYFLSRHEGNEGKPAHFQELGFSDSKKSKSNLQKCYEELEHEPPLSCLSKKEATKFFAAGAKKPKFFQNQTKACVFALMNGASGVFP